jgi:hypothetical protein
MLAVTVPNAFARLRRDAVSRAIQIQSRVSSLQKRTNQRYQTLLPIKLIMSSAEASNLRCRNQ